MGDFDWKERTEPLDDSTHVIIKDPNKCVLCTRCVAACNDQQGIHVWSRTGRGAGSKIVPTMNRLLAESACVRCGLCVKECPTAALTMAQDHWDISHYLDNKKLYKIARIEPSFIAELSTLSGFDDLDLTPALMVSALNKLGVNEIEPAVTAEKQAAEEIKAELAAADGKPLIIRDSQPVVRMMNARYPELAGYFSKAVSGQETFFKNSTGRDMDKEVFPIAFTSSIGRKDEAAEGGFGPKKAKVLTPLEIKRLFKRSAIELQIRKPDENYGHDFTTKDLLPAAADIIEDQINVDGKTVKVLIAQGLRDVDAVLRKVKEGSCGYDLLQLEAVPGEAVDIRNVLA